MKKRLIILISFLVVLGVIAWTVQWVSSPSKGRVSPSTPPTNKESARYDKKLDGTYFSFLYSSEYTTSGNSPKNNDLERHTLNATTQYNKQILASVVNLPDGRLQSNGDYIYRQKSSGVYANRKLTTGNNTIEIWVKNDGTEQTAMIPKGNKAVVLSVITAPGANSDLTTEMNGLLKTLEWKK